MQSPLGKYSQLVAALVAIAVIGTALFLHASGTADTFTDNLAFIAIGAIFGAGASTAVTNGTIGRDVAALHARLDKTGTPAVGGGG